MTTRMQRHALWLLLLCFQLNAALADTSGLLWKIERPGTAPSYLFGTIHLDDPRVVQLPAPVEQAFAAAQHMLLELEMTPELALVAAQKMMLPPDTSLAQRLDPPLYRRTLEVLTARGVPEVAAMRMKPWAIAVALSTPAQNDVPLDLRLHQKAVEAGKRISGLESVDEQLGVFDALTPEEEAHFLTDTLQNLDQVAHYTEALLQAYLQRDLAALQRLSREFMSDDSAYAERLMTRLVDERNRRMAERMQFHLQQGQAFIGVGALHLPGEQGLIRLLRQRGWTVSAVY